MANTKLPARLLDTSAIPALNVTGDLTVDTTTLKVDSTNNRVGIGIASPTTTLSVVNDSTNEGFNVRHSNNTAGIGIGYNTIQATGTNTNQGIYLMSKGAADIILHTNSAERMRIDSSGNVGIGTIPNSGGHDSWANLSMGTKGSLLSSRGAGGIYGMIVTDNLYIPAATGSLTYRTTNEASYYMQEGGEHRWYNAPSGSAGATASLTERMRIDSSGNATFAQGLTVNGVATINRGNSSIGAPDTANHATGTRIELYNSSATAWYALGIESNTMWFNSDVNYKFYVDAVSKVDFDGSGVVNAVGGYKINGTTVMDDAYVGTSAPSSPSAGQLWFNSTAGVSAMYVYNGASWDRMSNKVSATGGTVSQYTSGGAIYKVHTFTSSGTFTTESSGTVDVLVVAGGGGGHGGYQSPGGGGGGAGGVIMSSSLNVTAQAYTVTVGAGGAGGIGDGASVGSRPTSGGNSTFSTLTAIGGGYGGGYANYSSGSGGSAGGSGYGGGLGSPTSGQGNAGGDSAASLSQNAGGGGGKGGAGGYGNNNVNTTAGVGGVGQAYSISGSSVYYAGGGGGGSGYQQGSGGTNGGVGGNGGGGAGGASNSSGNCNGTNGTANTGGGGGGAGGPVGGIDQTRQSGGNGGSGIVIIRYAV